MKARNIFLILALGIFIIVTAQSGVAKSEREENTSLPHILKKINFFEPLSPEVPNARLEGGLLELGTTWEDSNPAIAYSISSDQYLYVYQSESGASNGVFGRFVEQTTGTSLGSLFVIAQKDNDEINHPDVVYDPNNDRFLVVWEEKVCLSTIPPYCFYEIKGRLIHGAHQSGSQFAGDTFQVASQWANDGTGHDLRDPAVAYNSNDNQFMVAFTRGKESANQYYEIYGQALSAHANTPTVLGPLQGFEIWNYGPGDYHAATPDIAWSSTTGSSSLDGTFLVVWQRSHDTQVDTIDSVYLYETYQTGGNQSINDWTIAPYNAGDHPLTSECSSPAVAFDPMRAAYVVLFEYLDEGEASARTSTQSPNLDVRVMIYAQRVSATNKPDTFRYDNDYAFPIESILSSSYSHHFSPDLVFAGLDGEMQAIYQTYNIGIDNPDQYYVHLRTLRGTNVGSRLQVRAADESKSIANPTISCTTGGHCLSIWKEAYSGDGDADNDILGQRIAPICYSLEINLSPACPDCFVHNATPPVCENGTKYPEETEVTLTAVDFDKYKFSHWSGDASGVDITIKVTMNADKSVTANFAQTKAVSVLVDEIHDNQLSLDQARAQEIEANIPWNDDWRWFYLGQLATNLSDSFPLTNDPAKPLTYNQLKEHDALLIPHYNEALTASEVSAVQKFVASGGGLLILGDCGFEIPNPELLETYDIEIYPHCIFSPIPEQTGSDDLQGDIKVTSFATHNAVEGLESFTINWGGNLGFEGNAVWLAWTEKDVWEDTNQNGLYDKGVDLEGWNFPVIVGNDTGCGRVAVISDNSFADSPLEGWPENSDLISTLLSWVTNGKDCEVGYNLYLPIIK